MDKKCIIFDVDGTIADVEHRRHLVSGEKKDWKSFRLATEYDKPVEWVCAIARRYIEQGDDVAFFSARNESEREITEKQILEWKEELAKQVKTKDHAKKVLDEAILNINVLQGGIQFGELLLKKNESLNQPTGIVELDQQSEKAPSKK